MTNDDQLDKARTETAMLDPQSEQFARVVAHCLEVLRGSMAGAFIDVSALKDASLTLEHEDALSLCPEHTTGRLGRCLGVELYCFECGATS